MQRIKHNGMFYRVAAANRATEDARKMCHFHEVLDNDNSVACPRMPREREDLVGSLVCTHHDKFDVGFSSYLIRDTKQGRAEWLARKLEN